MYTARQRPLRGWDDDGGERIGWSPIGHIQQKGEFKGAIYMGGRESYWWVEPERRITLVNITQVYWSCTVTGWDEMRDDLKAAVENAISTLEAKQSSIATSSFKICGVGAPEARTAKKRAADSKSPAQLLKKRNKIS